MPDGRQRPRLDRATFRALLDEIDREREQIWLRARMVTDRRGRIMDPRTRARAVLELTEELAGALARARDPAARARFEKLRARASRIADGVAVYELDDRGVAHPVNDQHRALAELAGLAQIPPDDVDDAAARIAAAEDAALAAARQFMATLPPAPAPDVRPTRSSSYGREKKPPPVRYDDTALISVLDHLDAVADPRAREAVALGYLGDHLQPDDLGPLRKEVRDDVRLVAMLDVVEALGDAIKRAARAVEQQLAEEFPRARADDPDRERRRDDLLGEHVQPLRERLTEARSQLLTAAHRVCSIERWPGSREQKRSARALELARRVKAAGRFDAADLREARLRSGF